MTNNTTLQYIIRKVNAIVVGGNVKGQAATTQDHFETVGTFVANGSSAVTVTEPNVGANSSIIFTLQTVGGTVGAYPTIKTITPGTGFTVTCTALDTSTYLYRVIGKV